MDPFESLDLFDIDALLTEDERMIRDTVRQFASDKILPCIREHTREGTLPRHLIPEMAELGVLGANLDGYECAGLGPVAYGLIMQEIERADSGLRSFVSVQGALAMYPIYDFGSEEQKQKWLPAMARGEKIGCFGLTEPDFGSNPGGIRTRARKDGDSLILNGNKMWITNGTTADIAVIWARTEDGTFRGFLVEKGTPGFEAIEIRGKYSLRASDTAELVLEDCRIPSENVLPETNGLKYALKCLNQARYGIAWGAVGAAQACFDEALRYSKARIQFGKPIASFQLVQQKLAHMATELSKSQLLCLRLGRLKEQGKIRHYQISVAKRNNVFHALETARTCRDILGGNGILDEYHAMRHMMNLETVFTYEGTHDIHALVIAEHLTGIPAYE